MNRTLLALALVLGGCATSPPQSPPCVSNEECAHGNVCFAEGCGDPLRGIVIEVSGNGIGGQYARDFAIDDGTLGAAQNLDFGEPLRLIGEFQRGSFYAEPVKLQAVGASELIPGVSRVYQALIEQPMGGAYQLALGAGRFRVTAIPVDAAVPPVTVREVVVRASFSAPQINFLFPTLEQAITLSGRLLKKVDTTRFPSLEVPLTATGTSMDVQAFDSETNEPLSQRFPVSSGQPGANGNFTMTLSPRVKDLKTVLLLATPRDATLPLPTKKFVLTTPLPAVVTLELGDTGAPLIVTGRAIDADQQPIANASVLLDGSVNGNGTFRSRLATTDATGAFTLDTLPGAGAMKLTVMPPPESLAAVTTFNVRSPASDGPLDPAVVKCDVRATLTGQVLNPDGAPAQGVVVRAIEQVGSSISRPLPLEGADTQTEADGRFSLRVDPATWRLEFSSSALPLASRLVVVSTIDANGNRVVSQELKAPVTLSRARSLTGVITGTNPVKGTAPVSWATVRVFRVTPGGSSSTVILMGTTVADERGRYSVNLPR